MPNGTKTVATRLAKPDSRLARQGDPRSRSKPTCRDELCCAIYRARIHRTMPDHRAARLCPHGDRLRSREVPGRIEIAQALPQQLSQPWRFPRRLYGRDRQETVRAASAEMAAHRRLLVSKGRHADRRVLAGGETSKKRVGARPGRRPLSWTRLTFQRTPTKTERAGPSSRTQCNRSGHEHRRDTNAAHAGAIHDRTRRLTKK